MNYNSFAEMYYSLLNKTYTGYDDILSPRGLKIRECQNVLSILNHPENNLFNSIPRPFPLRYLAGELFWYLTGRNDVKFISNYSSFWKHIANKDGTTNSAYGHLLFKETPNEWHWAYLSLIHDRDTRQAIMHFNKPHHMIFGIKDFPCTLTGTFQIRKNQLDLTIVMRSQDMIKGLTFDLPFFSVLQQCMFILLKKTQYKDLQLGKLSLFVHSLHIYESDFKLASKMLISGISVNSLPLITHSLLDRYGNYTPFEQDAFDLWMNNLLSGDIK